MGVSFTMSFLFLFAGSGGDLLDLMSTADYWQAKGVTVSASLMLAELAPAEATGADAWIKKLGDEKAAVREEATTKLQALGAAALPALREAAKSKDPEVAARAQMLVDKLVGGGPKAGEVRRLMAIRALGELKAKEALPVLAKLAEAKELFVAEYAKAATAAIEGKPAPKRPEVSAEDFQKDLALLPPGCGVVAQARLKAGNLPKIDDLLASLPAEQRDQARPEIIKGLLKAADTVGNVRITGATFGSSGEISHDTGFIFLAARGLYDGAALGAALRAQGDVKSETVERTEVLRPGREFALLLPGPDRLIILGGPARKNPLPVEEVAKAIQAGGSALDANEPLTKLIQAADKTKTVWAVAKISESYRGLDLLKGIDTATLEVDANAGQAVLSLTARATDANAAADSLQVAQGYLGQAREKVKQGVAEVPALQPIADFLESVKLSADGATIKATAMVKDPAKALTSLFVGLFTMRSAAVERSAVGVPGTSAVPMPAPLP